MTIAWPDNWRAVPLWSLFDRVKDLEHPHEEMLSVYRNHGVVKKSSRDDNMNKTAENRNIYQLVDAGWLVVNRMKAWQGSVGISPYRGIVSGHYICFRPKHGEDSRFLNWLLRSSVYAMEYARLSRGVRPNQIEIDNDWLRILSVRLPPLQEQRRIADFLDSETARIDLLASLHNQQLNLLGERILVCVSELFPGAGRCNFVRLGYFATIQSGITVDSTRKLDGEVVTRPYLRVANVQAGWLDLESVTEISVPVQVAVASTLRAGDILMTEGGDLDKLGRGTVWYDQIPSCLHQNHVFAVRPGGELDSEYLALLTRTAYSRRYFESTGTKTTNLASTSSSRIKDFRVPLISRSAQARVVRDASRALADVESLNALLGMQLKLLAERRQAVITAAVTGQIDVTTARRASEVRV